MRDNKRRNYSEYDEDHVPMAQSTGRTPKNPVVAAEIIDTHGRKKSKCNRKEFTHTKGEQYPNECNIEYVGANTYDGVA